MIKLITVINKLIIIFQISFENVSKSLMVMDDGNLYWST